MTAFLRRRYTDSRAVVTSARCSNTSERINWHRNFFVSRSEFIWWYHLAGLEIESVVGILVLHGNAEFEHRQDTANHSKIGLQKNS